MAGQASISTEILARYAADAAREVDGVRGLADSPLPRKHAVRVSGENGAVRIELHLVTEWGAWGTVYHDDDGRLLGSMQYGPAGLFPRARELPAGPVSADAVLVTCAYLTDPSRPWVMQSLFLTAIGDSRERGARALEAFAYRYPEGETNYERFHVHRTIFPADFLADFGFLPVRAKNSKGVGMSAGEEAV